jgi:hypothetical protein
VSRLLCTLQQHSQLTLVCFLHSVPIVVRETYTLAPDLYPLGSIGNAGSRAVVGESPGLNQPRGMQACPWSNSTMLVADSGNNRVLEIDVTEAVLVKVSWRQEWPSLIVVAARVSPDCPPDREFAHGRCG